MSKINNNWPFYPFGHKKGAIQLDGWIQINDDPHDPIWVKSKIELVEECRWQPAKEAIYETVDDLLCRHYCIKCAKEFKSLLTDNKENIRGIGNE